jgi:transposase InsO family protein
VHIDIKHLPKLQTANGERRKRYLYVAIDRCSRWFHLAVHDDELTSSAIAFLKEAIRAFPFKVTHVLTDRGSCFTADGFEAACRQLKVEHRTTKPYTPQTNGLVERFNGRVQREVLGITIDSHRDLETLLKGFNQAYNRRRQRVLKGRSPDEVVRSRLAAEPKLANRRFKPPDPYALPQALQVVAHAKEVSHQDIAEVRERHGRIDILFANAGIAMTRTSSSLQKPTL